MVIITNIVITPVTQSNVGWELHHWLRGVSSDRQRVFRTQPYSANFILYKMIHHYRIIISIIWEPYKTTKWILTHQYKTFPLIQAKLSVDRQETQTPGLVDTDGPGRTGTSDPRGSLEVEEWGEEWGEEWVEEGVVEAGWSYRQEGIRDLLGRGSACQREVMFTYAAFQLQGAVRFGLPQSGREGAV
jgi:hypothetical protein